MNINSLPRVQKTVLDNGLAVLVLSRPIIPKVSAQLWYNVGSKHERSGERGLAHFLEHMMFKGTERLSESDINMITHKLSGYTNAFTSYDYTGYLFDFPTQHWPVAFDLLADTMTNTKFDEQHWRSEIKAVIQELRMYLDEYGSVLVENLISQMFADHPYHHPIIGYKQDLWNLSRENLIKFYKHHYIPNNATLVVVGDVVFEDVVERAQKAFGHIPANPNYQQTHFTHLPVIGNTSVTLYRDVTQPLVILSCLAPASIEKIDYAVDIISWMLGSGAGSRLYNRLVNEQNLVSDIDTFSYDTFDQGIFFIQFQPIKQHDIPRIIEIIKEEIADLAKNYSNEELDRAINKAMMDYVAVFENNQKCAYAIGKSFTATGDHTYLSNYIIEDRAKLREAIDSIFARFMHPNLLNTAYLLPLQEEEIALAHNLQQACDEADKLVVDNMPRTTEVEPGRHVEQIERKPETAFVFPRYQLINLSNGLEVVYYHNPGIPKVDLLLEMECKYHHDPIDHAGIGNIVGQLLREGTAKHTAGQLGHLVESKGMSLSTAAGTVAMKMLSEHLKEGLGILNEILTSSTMTPEAVERVKERTLSDLTDFWDTPTQVAQQLLKDSLYLDHPYHKNGLGTIEGVKKITPEYVQKYYHYSVTPRGARLALVGDLSGYDIPQVLEEMLSNWQGNTITPLHYPDLATVHEREVKYPMTRDQVVLMYGGLSVKRADAAFDKCLLFDQIFGGGALNSMSSRLFELREQSGLFYTISGTLLANADTQRGMALIKTIVSLDRLEQARKEIKHTINESVNTLTDDEVIQAQQAVINTLVDNFDNNRQIASTFLFLRKHNLPVDFFDHRANTLRSITRQQIQEAVRPILDTHKMVEVMVGRV